MTRRQVTGKLYTQGACRARDADFAMTNDVQWNISGLIRLDYYAQEVGDQSAGECPGPGSRC